MDQTTTELMFGGGAGGGKTFFGCAWLIYSCGALPGSRWLMGRSKLKNLKQTTLNTFFEVCQRWGIQNGVHYKFNAFDGTITFNNQSQILLKDLFLYPADPNFDSLGSLEITGGFIDEAQQVTVKAKNIVSSRIRYKLKEFNIIPKLLMSVNPAKNYTYIDFYKPYRDGKLPPYRRFVQALARDNKNISEIYIQQLHRLDKNSRERLLNGNWEYDDDPTRLFEIEKITDIFTTQTNKPGRTYERYVTVDVARHGSDRTVIMRWDGLQVKEVIVIAYCGTNDIVDKVKQICQAHDIGRSAVIVDEDGVGGGVVDNLPGCIGFLNNGKPVKLSDSQIRNYTNLKSQCYHKLSELVNDTKIGVECSTDIRDMITEELEQIKEKSIDVENKVAVISKEEIRESLGRSPDFADAMMMRMVVELLGTESNLSSLVGSVYNNVEASTIVGDLRTIQF